MEEKEGFSLLDLVSYEESGPVLKTRPSDIPRTSFDPEEMVYSYEDEETDSGKRLTKEKTASKIRKKALGLTDIPNGSPNGAQGFRSRDFYGQQDFEAAERTGFGGKSIVDVEEDKSPRNIERRQVTKPINIPNKTESEDFFSFLDSGK